MLHARHLHYSKHRRGLTNHVTMSKGSWLEREHIDANGFGIHLMVILKSRESGVLVIHAPHLPSGHKDVFLSGKGPFPFRRFLIEMFQGLCKSSQKTPNTHIHLHVNLSQPYG